MNWFDCLTAFVKVAELGGFSSAARDLKTSSSDITKRIQWLEKQCELPLFIRTTRQVNLTEEGKYFIQRVKSLMAEWADISAELLDFQANPKGELTLCMSPQVCQITTVSQGLVNFSREYPHIQLTVITSSEPVSLVKQGIDIFIGRDTYICDPATVRGISLLSFHYGLYAAPSYLSRTPAINTLADLVEHNCLIYCEENTWEINDQSVEVTGNFRADNGDGLLEAGVQGLGIMRLPSFIGSTLCELGKLQAVLPGLSSKLYRIKLFYAAHTYQPRKITAFLNCMKGVARISQRTSF